MSEIGKDVLQLKTRARVILAVAAFAALLAGAFEPFYLRMYTTNRAALGARLTELAYRRIPGLRAMLLEVDRRTPAGARVLLVLPHRPWQGGYGYGFRRAQYMLAKNEVVPLLDRTTDRVDLSAISRADYIACWRRCAVPNHFVVVWQDDTGMLLRRGQ